MIKISARITSIPKPLKAKRLEYGLQNPPPACGLCQTAVPCEFEIPRPDLIA